LKQAAQNLIDMERGCFPYPEGTPGVYKDGRPKIVKSLAFRTPGKWSDSMYSAQYVKQNMRHLMDNTYFKQQFSLFRQEKNQQLVRVLEDAQDQYKSLEHISVGLLNLVANELDKGEECSIPPKEALKYAPVYTKLWLEIEGKLAPKKQDKMAVLMFNVSNRIEDHEELQRVEDGLADFRQMRAQQIEEMRLAREALDEQEVIDAEVIPDSEA
jgi:hypothetical protein